MTKTTTTIPIRGIELLYGLRDSERYIYHYTSAITFLDKIAPTNTIRLSPYTKTNDPKESKQWQFSASIRDSTKYSFEDWPSDKLCSKMNEGLKHHTNVACFSCDGELTGDHLVDIYNRGWCKPRMWSQYGDEHKGVCLVFQRDKLEAAFRAAFPTARPWAVGRVSYCNRPVLLRRDDPTYFIIIDELAKRGWEEYIRNHLQQYHKRLFFEKNADWSAENEYRFVVWGGTGSSEFINFDDSLRGVMFGASASDETIRAVYSAVRDRGVFTQQLRWQGCAPWYNLEKSFEWEIRYREEMRANASRTGRATL